jgi:hypothetical protein
MAFYHPLTLGVRRSRPSEPSKALTKGAFADLSYDMWREGLARLDITYEERRVEQLGWGTDSHALQKALLAAHMH